MAAQTEMKLDDPLAAALSYLRVSPNEEEMCALRYLLQAIADGQGALHVPDPILYKGELGELTAALLDVSRQGRYSAKKWRETYRSALLMADNAPLIQYPHASNFARELSGAGDVPDYVPVEIRQLCKRLESNGPWLTRDWPPNSWQRNGIDPLTAETVAKHLSGEILRYIHPKVVRQLTYESQRQNPQHQIVQEKLWRIVNDVEFTNEERKITELIVDSMPQFGEDVPDLQSQLKVFRYGELLAEISYALAYNAHYLRLRDRLRREAKPKQFESYISNAVKRLQALLNELELNYTIREIVGKRALHERPAKLDQTPIVLLLDQLEEKAVSELQGVRTIASLKHKGSENSPFIRTILPYCQQIFGGKSNALVAGVVNLVLHDYKFTSRDVGAHVKWITKMQAGAKRKSRTKGVR